MALVVETISASTLKDGVATLGLEGTFNAALAPILNFSITGFTVQIVDVPRRQGMSIECQLAYDDTPLGTVLASQLQVLTFTGATQQAAQAQAAAFRASQPLWFFATPFYVHVVDPIAPGTAPHVVLQVYSLDGINGSAHWAASGAGGGGDLYTNATPVPVDIGGVSAGDTFLNQTMTQMWDAILYPTLFPVLTDPSSTFALAEAGVREIGETLDLNFLATFNRGSIAPAYGTSGFRSGLPNTYLYTGVGLADTPSVLLTDGNIVAGHVVALGVQSWTGRVAYDAGEQPLDSKGGNFDAPLAAGNTGVVTRSITGAYPTFATSVDIAVMTKQALVAMTSNYVQVAMVAEVGADKQKFDLPDAWVGLPLVGIQFFNTVSNAWEWINGSEANSLLTFTAGATTQTIQGNVINYTRYTHNGALIGARSLRFYFV